MRTIPLASLIFCVFAIALMCLFFINYAQRHTLAPWNWIVFFVALALGLRTMLQAIRKLG
jgi:RsiW-degrading membrane proteinase PrsW (M82 family)